MTTEKAIKWTQVLPRELHTPAKLAALQSGMTLEQWVASAIRNALEGTSERKTP